MNRFVHVVFCVAALWMTESAVAIPLGLRLCLWNGSARESATYTVEEVLGEMWVVVADGVGEANGYDDATAVGGKSVKFIASDDSLVWVETVVTNSCRVSFDWKSSCEPLIKGKPYDYLSFVVDGERVGFVCGETDWTNMTFDVMGEGEHVLRWTFLRDEDGSAGDDCAWLANVSIGSIPPETFGEYLNWPGQEFTTGGDAEWVRVQGASDDGYALRSGAVSHSQESRLETVVSGAGTILFSCRVEGEIVKKIVYDGLAFCVDGVQQGDLIGNTAWTAFAFEVSGSGAHTLSWMYVKDEDGDGAGEDCAWLDNVVWTPSAVSSVVDVGEKGTVEESGGGYVVEAKAGETLTEADFSFGVAKEAYVVNIAAGGKSATVALKSPEVRRLEDKPPYQGGEIEEDVGEDTDDSAGVLASVEDIVAKHGESAIKAKPTPKSGETVGALPVKTYEGLYYQAAWGDDLGTMTQGEKVQATGDTLYLGVIKQKGNKGFYKITVSEQ